MKKISTLLMTSLGLGLLFSSVVCADEIANRASLNSATDWLVQQQNQDGSWGNDENIRYLNTSAVVNSLKASNNYNAAYHTGIAWLENHSANNVDYISRKIDSLYEHGNNISADVNNLRQAKGDINQQGWGLNTLYNSSAIDSCLALRAMLKVGDVNGQMSAINYLLSSQLTDGGWSIENSSVSDYLITAKVVSALTALNNPSASVATALTNARTYINTVPITSSSLVLASVAAAIYKLDGLTTLVNANITKLLTRQNVTGDWGDIYTSTNVSQLLAMVLQMDTAIYSQRAAIADQTLRQIINAQLGKNTFDDIFQGELATITTLDLRNTGITTLAGFEGSTNLQSIFVNSGVNLSGISKINGVTVNIDSNNDGITDVVINNIDADSDGLLTLEENQLGTDPLNNDTDSDGIPDGFEAQYSLNPLFDDSAADNDSDGLSNLREYQLGSNPTNRDTDGDGMDDGYEDQYALDLFNDDSLLDADTDGLSNLVEFNLGTNPTSNDTDADGMPDNYEVQYAYNPLVNDAGGDGDNDGLSNLREYQLGSNPTNPDTDGDGMFDGYEDRYGLDVFNDDSLLDTDGDGLTNLQEFGLNTNPTNVDTDGDGVNDGAEVAAGTDPNLNIAALITIINSLILN